jgi:polyvinyl alcohol dehydrogenase (cytochrome)
MLRSSLSPDDQKSFVRKYGWFVTLSFVCVFVFGNGCLNTPAIIENAGTSPSIGLNRVPSVDWPSGGQNLGDTRYQANETTINNTNVSSLAVKWTFTTGASVSATPTVEDGQVYFPDWAGNLYALDANTGKQIWETQVSNYTGIPNDVSRTSPAVYNNELIFGDDLSESGPHDGARLVAVNRTTGQLLWVTQIETHVAAIITGAAVVYNGIVYQGVSSAEHQYALNTQYPCCTFRGSMVAVNAATGQILWKTYTLPDNGGATNQYSGASIWQQPVIDPVNNALYAGTGNNYTAPASAEACQQANPQATDCTAPDDYFETAIAMNLQTGAILWTHRVSAWDVWTVACAQPGNPSACPNPPGQDYDLGGSGGNLMGNVVGFGQKSGMYWAFNVSDGSIAWSTQVGPGGNLGGVEWGTATDGQRIYVAITNNEHFNYVLANGQTITGSAWNALDSTTGKILWQTPDPTQGSNFNFGSVSVANGVMYAGALDGHMYAFDAATGKILWSYLTAGSVLGGPAIVNGIVYWGSGYARSGGTGNNKIYAFSLPDATPIPRRPRLSRP